MESLDELFADEEGREELQAAVSEALGLSAKELNTLDVDMLRGLFDALPEPVRNVAYEWGLADAMFVNNVRFYLKRYPSHYRIALGLRRP
jgi:hypothetical protein